METTLKNKTKPAAGVLEVTRVSAYGKDEYRPECPVSELFAELLGQKNLTARNVETIKRLGFRVSLKGGEL